MFWEDFGACFFFEEILVGYNPYSPVEERLKLGSSPGPICFSFRFGIPPWRPEPMISKPCSSGDLTHGEIEDDPQAEGQRSAARRHTGAPSSTEPQLAGTQIPKIPKAEFNSWSGGRRRQCTGGPRRRRSRQQWRLVARLVFDRVLVRPWRRRVIPWRPRRPTAGDASSRAGASRPSSLAASLLASPSISTVHPPRRSVHPAAATYSCFHDHQVFDKMP